MNIGIIGDGVTDRLILLKIVKSIVPWNVNEVPIQRQSFRVAIDKYWQNSNENDFWFPHNSANEPKKKVSEILYAAFNDFQYNSGNVTDNDILIASTDTERHLNNPDFFFEWWAFSLTKIFISGIESFYHYMIHHQSRGKENLPLIIPILPFPSTDILVAAARNMSGYYGRKPNELKRMLYDTDNLRTIPPEDFEDLALKHITPDSINLIFKHIPESRPFINFLSALARTGQ
jgi:hypothetical protein